MNPAPMSFHARAPAPLALDDDLVRRPGVEYQAKPDESDQDAKDERNDLETHVAKSSRFRTARQVLRLGYARGCAF